MKVLISLFQVLVMVLVVLFVIGVLEVVSYRTVNKPLALDSLNYPKRWSEKDILQEFDAVDFYHEHHWTIRYTHPYWLTPKG